MRRCRGARGTRNVARYPERDSKRVSRCVSKRVSRRVSKREKRRQVYQLFHLLNGALMNGGEYLQEALAVAYRFLSLPLP